MVDIDKLRNMSIVDMVETFSKEELVDIYAEIEGMPPEWKQSFANSYKAPQVAYAIQRLLLYDEQLTQACKEFLIRAFAGDVPGGVIYVEPEESC